MTQRVVTTGINGWDDVNSCQWRTCLTGGALSPDPASSMFRQTITAVHAACQATWQPHCLQRI